MSDGSPYRRARDLWMRALDLPEAEREAFVRREAADPDVLDAVLDLLDEPDETATGGDGGPLDRPPTPQLSRASAGSGGADDADDPDADALLGTEVGGYRIESRIAVGGMGRVYRARQRRPERDVALKLLDRAFASPELERRFALEVAALGRLQHEGIAQVFEAGAADLGLGPRPFFAMELIDGRPLIEQADALGLDRRRRIALLADVADAVQHAHQRGVIHRDLKPANILLTTDVRPKILDFGIARLTDAGRELDPTLTGQGAVVGTLSYMSPEQVGGPAEAIDTRADVYALGVTGCELLAGRPPRDLAGLSTAEALERVRRGDRPDLPPASREFPSDLRRVLAKALAPDREQRYATAAAFADDLRRVLAGRPILARPSSALYELRRAIGRHRIPFALTAALLLSLVAAAAILTVQARRLADERDRANREAETASRVAGFLESNYIDVDPWTGSGTGPTPEKLAAAARRVQEQLSDSPDVQRRLLEVLGRTSMSLGDRALAVELLREADRLTVEAGGPDAPERASILRTLAWGVRSTGDLQEAVALCRRALAIDQLHRADDDPERATALTQLGAMLRDAGRRGEAQDLLEQALELRTRLLGPDHRGVAFSLFHLGELKRLQSDFAGAEEAARRAMAILERSEPAGHPMLAWSIGLLGKARAAQGDLDEGARLAERALAMREALLPADHPDLADSHMALGYVAWRDGRLEEALRSYREALRIRRSTSGPGQLDTLRTAGSTAAVLEGLGRLEESERLWQESLDDAEERFGAVSSEAALCHYGLGMWNARRRRFDRTRAELRRAVEIWRETGPPLDHARGAFTLASGLTEEAAWDEAIGLFREVVALRDAGAVLEFPPPGAARAYLARLLLARGDAAEALPLAERAAEVLTGEAGAEHPRTLDARWTLARARLALGRPDAGAELRAAAEAFTRPGAATFRRALVAGLTGEGAESGRRLVRAAFDEGFDVDAARTYLQFDPDRAAPALRAIAGEIDARNAGS